MVRQFAQVNGQKAGHLHEETAPPQRGAIPFGVPRNSLLAPASSGDSRRGGICAESLLDSGPHFTGYSGFP